METLKRYQGRILFGSASILLASLYAFDRYETTKKMENYIQLASKFGSQFQEPEKVLFLIDKPNKQEILDLKKSLQKYSLKLLDAAGIDYEFVEQSRKQLSNEYIKALKESTATETEKDTDSQDDNKQVEEYFKAVDTLDFLGRTIFSSKNDVNVIKSIQDPEISKSSFIKVQEQFVDQALKIIKIPHKKPNVLIVFNETEKLKLESIFKQAEESIKNASIPTGSWWSSSPKPITLVHPTVFSFIFKETNGFRSLVAFFNQRNQVDVSCLEALKLIEQINNLKFK